MKILKLLQVALLLTSIFWVNNMLGQEWTDVTIEDYKIFASDGTIDDEFGHAVAIENGMVVVGMPYDDDNGPNSGAAYVYSATTGAQIFKLLPLDGTADAQFGYSIAISNGIAVVGAKGDNENGTNAGAAYLFDVSTGNQLTKILASDGVSNDEFGNSVDIDNGIVAVGAWRADTFGDASGAAYLFDTTTGTQLQKLLPDSGNNFQTFGVSIAIDNQMVAVGARTYFVAGEGFTFAKAYLFDAANGNLTNTLQPDILNLNGDLGGFFADAIDIEDGLIAVGAPERSVVFEHSGAAYVFDATSGSQLHYLVPDDVHVQDNFGISVSIDNGVIAIGSHQDDDNGFNSGSAYFYDAITGDVMNKVVASDGEVADLFGCSIAINGNTAVIGAKSDDDNGNNSGSAYIYSSNILGIESIDESSVAMYPNPSSQRVTIALSSWSSDLYDIQLYNSLGQLVKTIAESNFNAEKIIELDVSEFKNGIYFVAIRSGNKSIVKKLLVN